MPLILLIACGEEAEPDVPTVDPDPATTDFQDDSFPPEYAEGSNTTTASNDDPNTQQGVDAANLEPEDGVPSPFLPDDATVDSLVGNGSLPTSDQGPATTISEGISHDGWDMLLQDHVTSSGKVDYAGFKKDKDKLEEYLNMLRRYPPESDWGAEKELAYWINVYNAFTVKLIVDNYPVSSIKDTEGGKPWDKRFVDIDGKTYTLSEVENDIIRGFGDARIHFAVNCASVSCPKLLNKAYTESNLDSQLRSQTIYYLGDEKQNVITKNSVKLSQIFNWYQSDFDSYNGVIGFINKHYDITVSSSATVEYLEYDWDLND